MFEVKDANPSLKSFTDRIGSIPNVVSHPVRTEVPGKLGPPF